MDGSSKASVQILIILGFMLGPLFCLTADLRSQEEAAPDSLFVTANRCMACHNGLVTPSGEDGSIGIDWRASMMANSARDPYWQAAVRREVLDHPEARADIENECSTCHMPMARFEAKAGGRKGEIFAHLPVGQKEEYSNLLAADGVSCTLCHQILEEGLGSKESFVGGFVIDTTSERGMRMILGPFEVDGGRTTIMLSASGFSPRQAPHIQDSELCATCHTLYTHALGPEGDVIGQLPEQVPYLEWRHSFYSTTRSCQSCHMPVVEGEMPISSVLGDQRAGFSRHVFRGGNFFMPRILNRYRDRLGVVGLPQELDTTSRRTLEHLQARAASISIENAGMIEGRLTAEVVIESLAGHKLPTAYPSRRVWLRFKVRGRDEALLFESGALNRNGSIAGNDNDDDPTKYEPHHAEIDSPGEVQIYEAIMVDRNGAVTTGLLMGTRYVKDNRILPTGFDDTTAHQDIAVVGRAKEDQNFNAGSDRIGYSVRVDADQGPFTIEAELWYQPIGYRWAQNLRQQDAAEIERFTSYYESMTGSSTAVLARATQQVAP